MEDTYPSFSREKKQNRNGKIATYNIIQLLLALSIFEAMSVREHHIPGPEHRSEAYNRDAASPPKNMKS
jgi:hypothetical protein